MKLTAESSIAIDALSGDTLTDIFGCGELGRLEDCLPNFFLSSDCVEDDEPVDRLPIEALTPRAYENKINI